MTLAEIKNYIEHLDIDELIDLCNDISEWRYDTGELKTDCSLSQLSKDLQESPRRLEACILYESHERLGSIVKLLLKDEPCRYIR